MQRRSKLQPLTLDLPYEPPDVAPVFDLLRELAPRQRAVVILRHHLGYSAVEIGRILDLSPATVRVHLMNARRALRPLLEDDDED
jgi:DNA-directed RNA polymerase specialized sigma24 family protein